MLMMRVKVSLQILRCIFVHGEILRMHTIHESKYIVIKLPRNVKRKAKNNSQKIIQFIEVIKHN